MKSIVVCFIFISTTTTYSNEKSCSFNLHGEWEKYSPFLLYSKNNTFIINDNSGRIQLKYNENITIICPDVKNYLNDLNTKSTSAICVGRNQLKLPNKSLRFEELQCRKLIRGFVQDNKEICGDGLGILYKIGYELNNQFFTLIEVCYNRNKGVTLFTQHSLYGRFIKGASRTNYRPNFSPEGINNLPISVVYKQAYQKSTFNQLLNSSILSNFYINQKSYLSRGHLSPDADFLLAAWQYTTYYYLNTSPQWQIINGGNWKRIELLVRRTADHYQDTFQIITGNYGVLKLENNCGKFIEIYLVNRRLPVPKFTWKIVYSKRLHQAIVIVIVNNPFVKQINRHDLLCEDICAKFGWKNRNWSDIQRGFVYCCDYHQFIKLVKFAPSLRVDGVLVGIN